jgi:hypothetical protein
VPGHIHVITGDIDVPSTGKIGLKLSIFGGIMVENFDPALRYVYIHGSASF